MTTTIEFNDLEFSLYKGSNRLYQAPGFAIVREAALMFGEPAVRLARIHPQQVNQQYFSKMNADPLPQPIPTAANHADLVYLHLKEISTLCREDAVLAVPGTMNGDQLGILLGICNEAGIEVSGFVNSSVAAVATTAIPERVAYLDVYLQHIQVSELSVTNEVRHERSFEIRECGFTGLLEGWVNLIADRFVQETRFDPLHTAETEQQLYNQVYDWVVGAHRLSEVPIEIVHADQRRRVEVPKIQLEQKAQQRIDRMIEALPRDCTLALSARAARLPGFISRLNAAGYEICLLAADAVAAGCSEHMDLIRTADTDLRLISRLPHDYETATTNTRSDLAPTHLLSGHLAHPIGSKSLPVRLSQLEDGPWLTAAAQLTLNGEMLTADRKLCLGDVISDGNQLFTAIRLES